LGTHVSEKMPDLYEAFKSTEQKYGLEEAMRQWKEAEGRLDAERAAAAKLLWEAAAFLIIINLVLWICL